MTIPALVAALALSQWNVTPNIGLQNPIPGTTPGGSPTTGWDGGYSANLQYDINMLDTDIGAIDQSQLPDAGRSLGALTLNGCLTLSSGCTWCPTSPGGSTETAVDGGSLVKIAGATTWTESPTGFTLNAPETVPFVDAGTLGVAGLSTLIGGVVFGDGGVGITQSAGGGFGGLVETGHIDLASAGGTTLATVSGLGLMGLNGCFDAGVGLSTVSNDSGGTVFYCTGAHTCSISAGTQIFNLQFAGNGYNIDGGYAVSLTPTWGDVTGGQIAGVVFPLSAAKQMSKFTAVTQTTVTPGPGTCYAWDYTTFGLGSSAH